LAPPFVRRRLLAKMADHQFRCGDLLECTSKYYAEQLNILANYGIVMGTKPHHIHLWFESQNRSFWLTADMLRKVEDAEPTPLIDRIQMIVYSLNAEEWELEQTAQMYKLICYVDELSFETLQELRTYLDVDYEGLSLYPEGMGRMIAQTQWSK
jgi:hypothetical protein